MNSGLAVKGAALIAAGTLGLVGLGALGPVFDPGTAAADDAVANRQVQTSARPIAGGLGDHGSTRGGPGSRTESPAPVALGDVLPSLSG